MSTESSRGAAEIRAEGRLLSVSEAAVALTISMSSMRKLVQNGEIEIVRVTENRIAIERRALDAFIAARRRPAASKRR